MPARACAPLLGEDLLEGTTPDLGGLHLEAAGAPLPDASEDEEGHDGRGETPAHGM